jgi:hypothetical protein
MLLPYFLRSFSQNLTSALNESYDFFVCRLPQFNKSSGSVVNASAHVFVLRAVINVVTLAENIF